MLYIIHAVLLASPVSLDRDLMISRRKGIKNLTYNFKLVFHRFPRGPSLVKIVYHMRLNFNVNFNDNITIIT